jgi:hypothetical protein
VGFGEGLDLFEHTELEVTPLVHEFLQAVTLLPAVETVFHLFLFLFEIGGTGGGPAGTAAKFLFKRTEHLGDVIVELAAGEGARGGLLGVGLGGVSPCEENRFAPGEKVVAESVELLAPGE